MCIMYLGHTHNFNKAPAEVTDAFGVGYDYSSVMHYSSTAFSRNNQLKTIVPKVSTIYNINYRYKCSRRFSVTPMIDWRKKLKKETHTFCELHEPHWLYTYMSVHVRRIHQTVAFWILLAESSRVTPERNSVREKVSVRRTFWKSGGCTNAVIALAFMILLSMIIIDSTRWYLQYNI